MKVVKFIVPDTQLTDVGSVIEVPEADAAALDAQGWQRAEQEAPYPSQDNETKKPKGKKHQ